jgi:hypothetical protein
VDDDLTVDLLRDAGLAPVEEANGLVDDGASVAVRRRQLVAHSPQILDLPRKCGHGGER